MHLQKLKVNKTTNNLEITILPFLKVIIISKISVNDKFSIKYSRESVRQFAANVVMRAAFSKALH